MDYRLTTLNGMVTYRNITQCELHAGVLVLEDAEGIVSSFGQSDWNCIERIVEPHPQTKWNQEADISWVLRTLRRLVWETQGDTLLSGVDFYEFREQIDKVIEVLSKHQ